MFCVAILGFRTFGGQVGNIIDETTSVVKNITADTVNGSGGSGGSSGNETGNPSYIMLDAPTTIDKNDTSATFRSEADFSKFVEVRVDNNVIASSNYTVTEGSTIITLKDSYISTLETGTHLLSICSEDGYAESEFEVKEKTMIDGIEEDGSVLINEINFPDDIFRNIIQNKDGDNDSVLSLDERNRVTYLEIWGQGITSLKGIEFFPELTFLDCSENQLVLLDVSNNTKLTTLHCFNNMITELDLTNNPYLNSENVKADSKVYIAYYGSKPSMDLTNINHIQDGKILAQGDFSRPGNLVTINDTQYKVLSINDTQVKVMLMDNSLHSVYNYTIVNASFGDEEGLKYDNSILDQSMTTYYNSLPTTIQNAIIPTQIKQAMYSHTIPMQTYSKKAEIEVGQRYVYSLGVDDVIDYLGESYSGEDLMRMFYGVNTPSASNSRIWLRSTSSITDSYVVDGNNGYIINDLWDKEHEIRPAFILDLSLLTQ